MHTSSMCLEEHRARRRAGLLTQIRHREEASVEAQSLASERTTADIPEFAALRSCEAGAKTALIHIGALTADYVRRGEEMPVNLMLAQSELAGVRLALGALLRSDVAENRDHRSIVTVLRDAGEDSDG